MIANLASLRTWFLDQNKPYFTLSQNGVNRSIVARNETVSDIDQAWTLLETNILAQAEGGVANVKVFVTDKPKHNHGFETDARILPQYAPNAPGVAGIGSLPAGYVDEAKVGAMLSDAEARWEMKRKIADLEAQLAEPSDWTEKLVTGIERISGTPLGQVLMAKLLGVPAAQPMAAGMGTPAMHGTPVAPAAGDDEDEYDNEFYHNIEDTAALLGVDERTLAKRLAGLVKQNPDLAKSLLQ